MLVGRGEPGRLRPRPAQAEDDVALLVLGLEDVDLDLVPGLEVDRVGLAAEPELLVGDDALGLGADVDENLVRVHPDNDSVDDVAVVESPECLLLELEVVIHRQHGRGLVLLTHGRGLLLLGQKRACLFGQEITP